MLISIVAGGSGFIGVNLVSRLIKEGRCVVVLDNFSRGSQSFLPAFSSLSHLHVFQCDCSIKSQIVNAFELVSKMGQVDEVWHLAANSDIPAGISDPSVDLKDTFLTTYELLNCMRIFDIPCLNFASSSAIYGDLGDKAISESAGPLLPISNYGAMKLASEGIISAAVEAFLKKANLFRFPNVVGVPATHGVILDFFNKLLINPMRLDVLGDGSQRKSYLHVSDLIEAMIVVARASIGNHVEVVNIGPSDSGVTVKWIAEQVAKRVGTNPDIVLGIGNKGWVGDVPKFAYSIDKISQYGWRPKLDSSQAIELAVDEIAQQVGF